MSIVNNNKMAPWPRVLINFPIILIAICQEYIWSAALIWDPAAVVNVTTISILAKFMPWKILVAVLAGTGSLAVAGFYMKWRINTLLALIPQQFILYLSAGGAIEAIYHGRFADGVERASAFLLADQCPAFLLAVFHTWAMFLILKYAESHE